MLRIVEISNAEQLTTERAKEVITNDYLYILKHNNSFLLVDDGNVHHMNSIIECTQEEYDLLSEIDSKLLYLVSEVVDEKTKYSIYYNGLKISADSHTHENKDILDKISESETGKFLFNGEEISGGSSGGGEIDPEQLEEINSRINDLNLRSVIGEKLDYIHVVLSTNQIMVQNDFVKFDKVIESNNMTLDPVSYTIPLKKGKTYEISINMYTYVKKDFAQVMVIDLTNDRRLVLSSTLSVTHTVQNTPSPFGSTIYTPDTDCIIGTKIVQTEAGGTINNSFGAFMTVKEIGRTHIVDPMDVKDDHVVEYGRFVLSENQTTNLIVGTHIKFDTAVYTKNLTIDPLTHTVKLKANKVYMIEVNLLVGGTVANYFKIKNVTDDVFLDGRLISVPVTSTKDHNSQDSISTLIETTKDIEIAVVFEFAGGTITTIFSDYSYLNIQEIAQPVVTEYNKEISNPLTTTDISQESPVGSVISYIGLTAPEHYLKCDGSIYNITDYPKLAEHFKNKYNSYNIYGGDGIYTFAVPSINKLIEQLPSNMSSNTDPVPFVALASSEYSASYKAWKAFNRANAAETDSWLSNTSSGWLQIDVGNAVLLKSFTISSRNYSNNSSSYAPKDFTLQGSNNGLDFTVLSTLIGETNWSNAETREYQVNSLISYKYYRLDITANNGGVRTSIGNFILNAVTVNNQFIKYEPTYYAVNQYGGFESTVLWEGNADAVGTYNIAGNMNDYDFIIVSISHVGASELPLGEVNNVISVKSIAYGRKYQFAYFGISSSTANIPTRRLLYSFNSPNTLAIDIIDLSSDIVGLTITTILGIKGQLPTLIMGGEF